MYSIHRWLYKHPRLYLSNNGSLASDLSLVIRQWGSHLDLRESHLLALAAAEHRLLQAEYEDYTDENSSGIACVCSVAVITVSKQTQHKSYPHLFCIFKLIILAYMFSCS